MPTKNDSFSKYTLIEVFHIAGKGTCLEIAFHLWTKLNVYLVFQTFVPLLGNSQVSTKCGECNGDGRRGLRREQRLEPLLQCLLAARAPAPR